MRWTGLFALMFLLPMAALAAPSEVNIRTAHVDRIVIFEHGLYQTRSAGNYKDPKAPGGTRGTVVNIDLVQRTEKIPAALEMEFGIRFAAEGGPEGAVVPITMVLKFPPPGLKEPGKSKPLLEYRTQIDVILGSDNYESYGFDYPWEVLPGEWTFELWANGKKMAEQKFYIVD